MILSINFAILTFFKFLSNFLKHFRVRRYENPFIIFLEGKKKLKGWHKKTGLAETQEYFLGLKSCYPSDIPGPIGAVFTKDWCITIFSSRKGDKRLYSHLSLTREWPSIVARGRIIPLKFEQYSGLTQ